MDECDVEDLEKVIKVIVVGNGEVGKSSLVRRFAKGSYSGSYEQTLGTEYLERPFKVNLPNGKIERVLFHLWDTAGAGVCLLVFSTDDVKSFYAIESWYEKVKRQCGEHIITLLVENKMDVLLATSKSSPEYSKLVNNDEAEALSRRLGVKFFRICVKNNFNVSELFHTAAVMYFEHLHGNVKLQPVLDIQDDLDVEELDFEGKECGERETKDEKIQFENVNSKVTSTSTTEGALGTYLDDESGELDEDEDDEGLYLASKRRELVKDVRMKSGRKILSFLKNTQGSSVMGQLVEDSENDEMIDLYSPATDIGEEKGCKT